MAHPQRSGHILLPVLAEEGGVGWLGEIVGAAGNVVAVGVDNRYAGPGQHILVGRRALAAGHVIVIMAEAVHHPAIDAEGEAPRLVEVGEAGADACEAADIVGEVVVCHPHAGRQVVGGIRRRAEVLAEEHQIVARDVVREAGIAVGRPVREDAAQVELSLGISQVAGAGRILRAALHAKEVARHMLHRVQPETIASGLVDGPAGRADQHRIDVLGYRIAHVVDPVAKAPCRGLAGRHGRVGAGVGEGLAGLAGVVPAVGIGVGPVEAAVAVGIGEGLFVREGVEDHAIGIGHARQAGVGIEIGLPRMTDAVPFRVVGALVLAGGIEAGVGFFLGDVPGEGVAVQHLPLVVVVDAVARLPPAAAAAPDEMEILRYESRYARQERASRQVVERPGAVGHDIVEIHPQAEAVGGFHQAKQFGFRPVAGGHRAGAILVAEVEAVDRIIADRVGSGRSLGRLGQP